MKNCYENHYNKFINEYKKNGKIKNLFNNQEISIIDILKDEYINEIQKFLKEQKIIKNRGNVKSKIVEILKLGGGKKEKKSSGININSRNVNMYIKDLNINTLINNIDFSKKFTFLQSINYLNEDKNKIEVNKFLKNLKTQLIDMLLLFYINKKEIIKTFLNEFSNRNSILNNNINNKNNNIIENNQEVLNIIKNKKIDTSIIDEKLKFYDLKNTIQIKKVTFLLKKLEEIKNLKNTPNYDEMVMSVEQRIRNIILN